MGGEGVTGKDDLYVHNSPRGPLSTKVCTRRVRSNSSLRRLSYLDNTEDYIRKTRTLNPEDLVFSSNVCFSCLRTFVQ